MDINKVKIVADSSCDLTELEGVNFGVAPLKIITAEKEYNDDLNLNVEEMVTELKAYRGKSTTSCPNTADWLETFGDAKYIFCVTISGNISGSYNAALMAKEVYEQEHPERKVFILNSFSAGPEITMIILKLRELILSGQEFQDVCKKIEKYSKKTGLFFILQSMQNFANNGRISPAVAKVAGLLGIRVIGRASDVGDLQPLDKCRGEKKSFATVIQRLKDYGFNGKKASIAHCLNGDEAKILSHDILVHFPEAEITIHKLRGLCSFYAESGGLLIGFEKE